MFFLENSALSFQQRKVLSQLKAVLLSTSSVFVFIISPIENTTPAAL